MIILRDSLYANRYKKLYILERGSTDLRKAWISVHTQLCKAHREDYTYTLVHVWRFCGAGFRSRPVLRRLRLRDFFPCSWEHNFFFIIVLTICLQQIGTLVQILYIVTSLLFSLEKISKEVMYHTICVNYVAKIAAGAGTGANPKWRLRLHPNTPAPKPCCRENADFHDPSIMNVYTPKNWRTQNWLFNNDMLQYVGIPKYILEKGKVWKHTHDWA